MKNILIVDDSPAMRRVVRRVVDISTVYNAANGKEGLEAAARIRPDLIILDIEMPEMDGLETLKRLKLNPETSAIDVLMCSSVKTPEVMDEAVRLYQQAAKAYPRQAAVHNNLGLCYASQKRLDDAVASLNVGALEVPDV